ncbi:hypothetical protein PIB30_022948 [Stylosanthes scabra]|uniref:Uncharacterized protein n=1 Tax=Stylosanthes scabra TaxID=79078 RepID=A0ABU6R9L6_9FABA|nr:hypothetical protein [Stylosanthes scabra]
MLSLLFLVKTNVNDAKKDGERCRKQRLQVAKEEEEEEEEWALLQTAYKRYVDDFIWANKASFQGSKPSVRYHFKRTKILTLCHDIRAKGQSQIDSFYGAYAYQKMTNACKGFLEPDGDWPSSAKPVRELDCKTHPSSRNESWP